MNYFSGRDLVNSMYRTFQLYIRTHVNARHHLSMVTKDISQLIDRVYHGSIALLVHSLLVLEQVL